MEGDVGRQRIVLALGGGLHAVQRLADAVQTRLVGVAGGQGGGGGLDAQPHLCELGQQPQAELALQHPAQDVGIQQVPLVLGLDHRAVAGAGAEQALGGQHLDGFACHCAAGAVLLGQLAFGGEADRGVVAGDDGLTERFDEAIGQAQARLGSDHQVRCPPKTRIENIVLEIGQTLCSALRAGPEQSYPRQTPPRRTVTGLGVQT